MKSMSNPDQQRLITEVKEWCSVMTQMVDDAGKKLVEEVMSSANPALLKFVKNEDICSLLHKIGFLTTVSAPSVSVQSMKKELTTIQEVEESGETTSWSAGSVVIAKWSEDSVWYNAKIEKILADGACEVLFLDYGNKDKVRPGQIVEAAKDIPKEDELDEFVEDFVAAAADENPADEDEDGKEVVEELLEEVLEKVMTRLEQEKLWEQYLRYRNGGSQPPEMRTEGEAGDPEQEQVPQSQPVASPEDSEPVNQTDHIEAEVEG